MLSIYYLSSTGTPSTRAPSPLSPRYPVLRTKTNTFLRTRLEAELRAAPVPPLRVPADLVARAHADPLGDGPVLGHLLRERPLRAERLVRRLRGGREGERFCAGRGVLSGVWCVLRAQAGVSVALFGVGRSTAPPLRSFAAHTSVRDLRDDAARSCGSRWAPELLARGLRAAPQPYEAMELRPARAR